MMICPSRRSILVTLFFIVAVFVSILGTNIGDVDNGVSTTLTAASATAPAYGSTAPKNSPEPVFLSSGPSATGDRFIVLVLTRLGWANRIRCIADWYKIAVITERKLSVVWDKTYDCNIHISEVIESVSTNVNFLSYPEVTSKNIEAGIATSGMSFKEIGSKSGFVLGDEDVSYLFSQDLEIAYTFYDGVITLPTIKCQLYLSLHAKFYSSLVPTKQVAKIVDFVSQKLAGNLMIGIHIRKHDTSFDWEVVPPADGSGKATKFGVGAEVSDFAQIMVEIMKSFANGPSRRPSQAESQVMFFVASNSLEVKESLVQYFPDNAISLLGDLSRNTSDGMIMAVAEWFILANSDLIINTYGSTFALQAALMRQIPLLGFHDHRLIYHHDSKLPFCGDLNYLQAYSKGLRKSEYEEGTVDRRKIAGNIVMMKATQLFEEWGISEVYTTVTAEEQEMETNEINKYEI